MHATYHYAILHFLADFAVPGTIIFKISLISTRSLPPTAGSARTQSVRQRRGLAAVPEIRIFTLKTDQARSGAPHFHFHARPGARSGALANFSLCRGTYMYLPKFWVSTPPPPPRELAIYPVSHFETANGIHHL